MGFLFVCLMGKLLWGTNFTEKIQHEVPKAATGNRDPKRRPSPSLLGKPAENGGFRPSAASPPPPKPKSRPIPCGHRR